MTQEATPLHDLAKLDEPVLAEVVREGELLLASQFQSSFAADQRALALAGIALTVATGLVGLLLAEKLPTGPVSDRALRMIALVVAMALIGGAMAAIHAALPARFFFPGNEPRNWRPGLWSARERPRFDLLTARLEQAEVLQGMIDANKAIAAAQAKWIRWSVLWCFGALVAGLLAAAGLYIASLN
jgi:hypothetical protein